jgi:YVTN family beta-propeller protein
MTQTTSRALRVVLSLLAVVSAGCRGSTDPLPADPCHGSDPFPLQGGRPAGTLSTRASGLTGRPFGIRASATGMVFVTQQDANAVARFALGNLAPSAPVQVGGDPGDVVFTRDGSTAMVSNFFDGTVDVIDATTGVSRDTIHLNPTNAYRLALSPNDARLYVTSTNGFLYAVDPTGERPMESVYLGGELQGIALDRAGNWLIVSSVYGSLWRVNACTLAIAASAVLPSSGAQDVAISSDQTVVYVANENGYVDVRDLATLSSLGRMPVPNLYPFGLAVTPDGTQLYVASSRTGQVAIINPSTGVIINTLAVGGVPRRIAFDAAGTTAVVSNEWNWVDVIR